MKELILIFFFFFGDTGVCPQDFMLAKQVPYSLSHSTHPRIDFKYKKMTRI
jgi:hypothetical protein